MKITINKRSFRIGGGWVNMAGVMWVLEDCWKSKVKAFPLFTSQRYGLVVLRVDQLEEDDA